ncbi:MAG: preprotein translocase subunit YajC [Acidimicrobiia bacterium]|nr:preprotein translocase subunit YajC [Acidimicrobiia bacterium]
MAFGLPQLMADVAWLLAQAEGETDVNPLLSWLPIILIIAAFYFFAIRPQRKRSENVRTFQSGLEIGDEVRTAGGIIGVVSGMSDNEVMLDVGGVTLRFVRGAILGSAGSEDS